MPEFWELGRSDEPSIELRKTSDSIEVVGPMLAIAGRFEGLTAGSSARQRAVVANRAFQTSRTVTANCCC